MNLLRSAGTLVTPPRHLAAIIVGRRPGYRKKYLRRKCQEYGSYGTKKANAGRSSGGFCNPVPPTLNSPSSFSVSERRPFLRRKPRLEFLRSGRLFRRYAQRKQRKPRAAHQLTFVQSVPLIRVIRVYVLASRHLSGRGYASAAMPMPRTRPHAITPLRP
jgi:hypothetical protein